MLTITRKPTPGFMAGLHTQDLRDIMRQELSLVGSTGTDPSGNYDILILEGNKFEVNETIPPEAIDAAVQRIFDRVMKKASADVLSQPDK
jgi:hypothetical protein